MKLRSIASRRFVSRAGIAALALLAVPSVTGCENRIGLAASVGSQRIETSELTAVTSRSAAALSATGQSVPADQLTRGVLNLLVRDALLEQIGKSEGVVLSPSDLAAERASEARQAGGEQALISQSEQGGVSATDLNIVVREKLLINELQSKFGSSDSTTFANKLTAAAQKIKVRVNPRFGQWDSKNLTISGVPNDLSSTVTKK